MFFCLYRTEYQQLMRPGRSYDLLSLTSMGTVKSTV